MLNLLSLSRNAAVFIGIIILLRQLLKPYLPRTAFVILWLAAAARMLCPFRLPSEISIWRLFAAGTAPKPGTAAAQPYWPSPAPALPVQDTLPSVFDFLKKLWLLGALILLIAILLAYLNGIRKARASERLQNGAYLCKGIASPQLCGIVHPRILLPEGLSEDLLPYILLHEQVHMRRLDNLWKLLALTAAAVHWFNPAAWVLVALLGRDLEVSCDEWVLRQLDHGQRRSYALALISIAGRSPGHSPMVCGFSQSPLEERIRYIMTNRKKSVFALSVATAMILCTTSAFATDAPVSAGSASPAAASTENENKYGVYHFTVKEDNEDIVVTAADGSDIVVTGTDDIEFATAEEYEAYIETEKAALQAAIDAGTISVETYYKSIQAMEDTLAGIQDGTMMAALPTEDENGVVSSIVVSTAKAFVFDGCEIHYAAEDDGSLTAEVGEKSYSVTVSTSGGTETVE